MKFAGGRRTHYQEQIKLLDYILGETGTGISEQDRIVDHIFGSTSIGFAAISNRCWMLASEFTD